MTFLWRIILANLSICVLFLIDRLTKNFSFGLPEGGLSLAEAPRFWGLGGFFFQKFISLEFYKNYYLIFNLKIPSLLLYFSIFLTLFVLLIFLVKNYHAKNTFMVFCFSLILIGAISNLLDRLYYGYVIDFLSFFDYSIFNLADVFIFVGAGLIILKLTEKVSNPKL